MACPLPPTQLRLISGNSAITVTVDTMAFAQSITMTSQNGTHFPKLTLTTGNSLTTGTISFDSHSVINGTGTLVANGSISGGGTINASSGLLDLTGTGSIASGQAVLSIGTSATLEIDLSGGVTAAALSITGANQTLEVGPSGNLTLTGQQIVSQGKIQLAGGTLADVSGIVLGSSSNAGTLTGFGTVNADLTKGGSSANNTITASGHGTLDLTGTIGSGLILTIDATAANTLKIDSTSTIAPVSITNSNQTLEIGSAANLTISGAENVASGHIVIDGGTLHAASGLAIGTGATLSGSGVIGSDTAVTGTGTITASGILDFQGTVDTTTLTSFHVANGGDLKFDGNVGTGASAPTITFDGVNSGTGILDLTSEGSLSNFHGQVANFATGDQIPGARQ